MKKFVKAIEQIDIFVNGTENIKFKVQDSDIVATLSSIGNISKDFSVDNLKKD